MLDEAIEAAVKLSHRYIPARQLPDKAVSLLDTACARVAVSQQRRARPRSRTAGGESPALEVELEIIGREKAGGFETANREAAAKEKVAAEKGRLVEVEARWKAEQDLVNKILDIRRAGKAEAERDKLHSLAAELTKLQGESPLIFPTVDSQAVAAVVGDRLIVDGREDQRRLGLQLGELRHARPRSLSRSASALPLRRMSRILLTTLLLGLPPGFELGKPPFSAATFSLAAASRSAVSKPPAFSRPMISSSTSSPAIRAAAVLDLGRDGALADGDAGAGRVEQAHRLVGQLARRDVAMRQLHRRLERLVENLHLVVLLQGRGDAAHHRDRLASSGSAICTTWNRRVSAGSFSMCFLYSAQVVAAMVRSLPRASAGLSRLAASPVPAAPPAPTSVCASSMKRMIGLGEDCTSSITWRSRFSNSPFMLAPACSRPTSSARSVTP